MKKPVIGILTNLMSVEEGPYTGGQRIYVNRDYVTCILQAGGIPLLLPIIDEIAVIHEQILRIDGLVLSGGQDVSPHYYKEEPIPEMGSVSPDRDFFEIHVIKSAISLQKPLLGVCRGLQMLNVACGGSLFQDIPAQIKESKLAHQQKEHRTLGTHEVDIAQDSHLFRILRKMSVQTNSFHHQAVKEIAPGFRVVGRSRDGVVEAIERVGGPFALGVQWHPEMMTGDSDMRALFEAFLTEVRKG